ncbi:hypothetical protein [Bacillus tropicus]|nr:hypothetical protein [Bacillus tropicus]
MIDIIFSFFLVVTYFIIYLFSSGEKKQQGVAPTKREFRTLRKYNIGVTI